MISGLGTDIVEVERIRRSIEKNESFKTLVFDSAEIAYCEQQGSGFQSYAGKFAAKEAFFKALGTGWRGNLAFYEVLVLNDDMGKPYLAFTGDTQNLVNGLAMSNFHVSISHTAAYATAVVIIEK